MLCSINKTVCTLRNPKQTDDYLFGFVALAVFRDILCLFSRFKFTYVCHNIYVMAIITADEQRYRLSKHLRISDQQLLNVYKTT